MGVDYLPVTRLCVHRGAQPLVCSGHRTETWTPCRPLEPQCSQYSYRRSAPPLASPPSIHPCYVFLSPPPPPSSLRPNFHTLPHPPTPRPHRAAIPLPCHLTAFRRPCTHRSLLCVCRETSEGAREREMEQRNKPNSVFLIYIRSYSRL